MGSILEALHRLQSIESQLAALRQRREAKARQIEIQKRNVDRAERNRQEDHRKYLEQQTRLDMLTLDVTARQAAIDKHRQALSRAKTNREYAAILTAMNTEKADTAKIENEILRLMETTQALKDEETGIQAEQARFQAQVAEAEETLRRLDEQSKKERERLTLDRDACADTIPPLALASFNRVAEHHDGEALAAVDKLSPKGEEYICSGCNMKVTLEVINTLRSRDEVQTCNVCGRLLFLRTDQTANR